MKKTLKKIFLTRRYKLNFKFNKKLLFFLFLYLIVLMININKIYLFVGDERIYSASVVAFMDGRIGSNNHPLLAKTVWYIFHTFFGVIFGTDKAFFWRAGTIVFSLATIAVFYKIAQRFIKEEQAMAASIILALDPMFFVFSRTLHLDVIYLFFTLLGLYFFLSFLNKMRTKFLICTGLALGLSLASKFISLPLILFTLISLLVLQRNALTKFLKSAVYFLTSVVVSFVGGNFLFFFKENYDVSFIRYVYELFKSQLTMQLNAENFLYSPPLSFFSIPQILTLFRVEYRDAVEVIAAFQNPIFLLTSLVSFIFVTYTLLSRKEEKNKELTVILAFFIFQYVPWFLGIHTTYYFYIIPLIPLCILATFFWISKFKKEKLIANFILVASVTIFVLYFPILVGLKIPKPYERHLFKYSLYQYPPKDSLFCQRCSPRN